jgi:hypothetical protein
MATALRQNQQFPASSPVTRYWVANCVGFSLAGGGRGTVERVFTDDDPHVPSALEVRIGRRRRRQVPASAVIGVIPAEWLLLVSHGGSFEPRWLRETIDRLSRALWLFVRAALPHLRWLSAHALRLAGRGGFESARLARRGGVESVRLVRSVPWQTYGRSARSATTSAWRACSSALSRRPTTSSEGKSAQSSAGEVRTTSST